jgi:hypothetical protein
VGADLVRARIWEHASDRRVWMSVLDPHVDIVSTTFGGRLPVDAVSMSLPGMFAVLAVGLAAIVIALGTALTAAPLLWVMTAVFLFFASSSVATIALCKSPLLLRPSPLRLSTTTRAACWR